MTDTREIRSKMTLLEITQRQLADLMGMSVTTLNKRLQNKSPFNLDEVEKLCAILRIHDPAEKGRIFLP